LLSTVCFEINLFRSFLKVQMFCLLSVCKKYLLSTSVYPRDGFRLMVKVIMGILQSPTHQYTIVIMKTISSQKEIVFARRRKKFLWSDVQASVYRNLFLILFFDGCMCFSFFKIFLCVFLFLFFKFLLW
jgi:hypothetical protein